MRTRELRLRPIAAALLCVAALWVLATEPFGGAHPSRAAATVEVTLDPAEPGGTPVTTAITLPATMEDEPDDAAPPTEASQRGATAKPTPARSRLSCRVGIPRRLVIPALEVDAGFERIGLDTSVGPDERGRRPLGNPQDRTRAGWYEDGPKPGSGRGTVLTNGHTYRNGSAIFTESFSSDVQVGQLIHIVQTNRSVCSYRISRVWREVDAARDYPRIVTQERLYNFSGPERLFLATCGGSWNAAAQDYDQISLLVATPVNRG